LKYSIQVILIECTACINSQMRRRGDIYYLIISCEEQNSERFVIFHLCKLYWCYSWKLFVDFSNSFDFLFSLQLHHPFHLYSTHHFAKYSTLLKLFFALINFITQTFIRSSIQFILNSDFYAVEKRNVKCKCDSRLYLYNSCLMLMLLFI
jgi:hypothetical protein